MIRSGIWTTHYQCIVAIVNLQWLCILPRIVWREISFDANFRFSIRKILLCSLIYLLLLFWHFDQGCEEYRKVDSVLRSVEEEERYEFTGGHFLEKLMEFKTCITITRTMWNFLKKIHYFITEFIEELLFCHCDCQKIEEIVSLLMRYEK